MRFIKSLYLPRTFWLLVILKLSSGMLFASHYVTKGFLPFVEYFLVNGKNPYDYFFMHANIVFPYPAGMLVLVSSFVFLGNLIIHNLFSNTVLLLFFFRLPILLADITIYIILCKLLASREKQVLWYYFASPILFYINYYHGQLDVIPTAFLILSLYYLFIKNHLASFITLGLGLATKSHLFIVLPFYIVYLIKNKERAQNIFALIALSLLTFLLINLPFVDKSYLQTVFNNIEQQRLFSLTFAFHYKDLMLLLAPGAILFIFYLFSSYRKLNFDSLFLSLALVFTVLISLVPPMQGWFYWSIPFLIFFLIKYKNSQPLTFWLMNVFFIAFFIFTRDSDVFESAAVTFPFLLNIPTPYNLFHAHGLNALLLQNISLTFLQVSIAMNAIWCYRRGIFYNNLYIEKQKPFVLGIAGNSAVGKSTLSEKINDLVGEKQIVTLNGDDSHKWERNDNNWRLFTHLHPKANKIHNDVNQLYALVGGNTIERIYYNHKTGKFTKPVMIENNKYIIFQGLHPFFLDTMRNIYDLKIYIDTQEKLRKKWKIERDTKLRGYSAAKVKAEITVRKKDAAKFITPQKKYADWLIYYSLIKNQISVKYTFSNSVPLEELIKELLLIKGVKITHNYKNMQQQIVTFTGKISKKTTAKIAYKLYPTLNDLLGNQPDFKENIHGVNQLFLINYLNFFFSNKKLHLHQSLKDKNIL